jgi:hypothetical protein
MNRRAIWLQLAVGRYGGRRLGLHLWELEEGERPRDVDIDPRPSYVAQGSPWWSPHQFGWEPFQDARATLFDEGYVRPFCGARTTSTRPRALVPLRAGHCTDCETVAQQRGMQPVTMDAARNESVQYNELQATRVQWSEAGRPDVWHIN